MSDPHHTWNDGPPIFSQGPCCTISTDTIKLCELGTIFKSWAEERYRFSLYQQKCPCNNDMIRASKSQFDLYRRIYEKHLETGWDWPQMMWGKDRCL